MVVLSRSSLHIYLSLDNRIPTEAGREAFLLLARIERSIEANN